MGDGQSASSGSQAGMISWSACALCVRTTCFASLFRLAESPPEPADVDASRLDRNGDPPEVKSDGSTLPEGAPQCPAISMSGI